MNTDEFLTNSRKKKMHSPQGNAGSFIASVPVARGDSMGKSRVRERHSVRSDRLLSFA